MVDFWHLELAGFNSNKNILCWKWMNHTHNYGCIFVYVCCFLSCGQLAGFFWAQRLAGMCTVLFLKMSCHCTNSDFVNSASQCNLLINKYQKAIPSINDINQMFYFVGHHNKSWKIHYNDKDNSWFLNAKCNWFSILRQIIISKQYLLII